MKECWIKPQNNPEVKVRKFYVITGEEEEIIKL